MGNAQGANGPITGSPSPPIYQSQSVQAVVHSTEPYGIPVPSQRSDRFEQELSSSLSGISGLSAHMASRAPTGGVDAGMDFISPGQYMTRLRANSVSAEPDLCNDLPTVRAALPAVVKWDKGGNEVSISGTFNQWNKKLPLVKSTHNFYTIINVEEGEHEYKYCVDGQWLVNPDEPTVTDIHGNLNNVMRVKQSDFEIGDALESDGGSVENKSDYCGYPQVDYGQEMPDRKPTERHVGPPVLPQHLLQVILNKDVPQHLEPGILHEPNHVMLNHLYALSIKDSVMVLSDTSRFKKKWVTTLLYKPID